MKKYDVVLVNPIKIRDSYSTIALGPLTVGTILKKAGFEVAIVDFNYLWEKRILNKDKKINNLINDMAEYLDNLNAKVIGFSTNSTCHHIAIELSRIIKSKDSNVKIILGGHQASLTAIETLKAFSWIDLIVIGECELNIVPIIKALIENNSGKLFDIKGIAYRYADNVIKTQETEILENLDEIPLLDYDLINLDIDLDKSNKITFPIEVGRSCPFSCTFCCTKTFWKQKFRMKSTSRLIEEIEYIMQKYGATDFHFLHDLFTFNKKIVIDFCNEIIKKGIKIRWICSARVDTISEELVSIMKQAGCSKIFLGIESGSDKIQKLIKKHIKIETIWDKVKIIRKHGIKVEAGFIYGFPGETKDDVNITLNMMLIGAANNFWFPEIGILNVENGTELYDELKNQLYIEKDIDNLYFFNSEEFEYFFEMFKTYPEMFPHFYDFSNATRQKYKYLDKFMWILVSMISLGYKTSINSIVTYHENDVLKFYETFIENLEEEFKNIFVENFNIACGNNKTLLIKRNSLLEKYVNYLAQKDTNSETLLIRELFDLDKNIVFLRVLGKENEQIEKVYNNNLMELRKHGELISPKGFYKFILTKETQTKVRIDCVPIYV
ncbi:radical SAM superfamily enzyme YgiQ (UPF0313 family) [Herbinix hemicellulosilytica]|uniref:Uncharacterized protein n=1 Tax=Herbinix hemicellulosilytica TaxID=1564487 RepID=A0A0H5STZ6_HERHM|nr:radical SAM protein [Herbinix hemicellulosilytica]RBP60069.1 radical SAM superfamily enzyme YgiQ (UPF0313 family) [Herbinix hemicellulosilytica]CRZ33793.1 hypothetical protein HHT355_0588 [Herbinix hemicellulosilytica]